MDMFYSDASSSRGVSFSDREKRCSDHFNALLQRYGGVWHVFTPGISTEVLNLSERDYRFSVSNMAISAEEAGLVVLTDAHMSNHIHALFLGERSGCFRFVELFRYRLRKHLQSGGRFCDLGPFRCDEPVAVDSLEMVRNEIAYIHRNGFVAYRRYTPYSYPWSGGALFFNYSAQRKLGTVFNKIPFRQKRKLSFRSRISLPDNLTVRGDMIEQASYIRFDLGEPLFRDAHHYFYALSKNMEAYSEEACRLGDLVVLSDEEIYPVARMISQRDYKVDRPSLLDPDEKIAVARTLHYKYHASNQQIRRVLKLDLPVVDSLFPAGK